jgi:predicted metalloprotease
MWIEINDHLINVKALASIKRVRDDRKIIIHTKAGVEIVTNYYSEEDRMDRTFERLFELVNPEVIS